ncbi:thymidylate kinase [Cordyceps militaris]|uniref:Thymidylate kinase n=1 Tax=Cordyceps militaris TaxID=73501 RepID=A0A2H4S5C2_CORMI|nr:thymidylate kinase [Cordyceps militaris]
MAAIARQPFAPVDTARLLGLASTKNRQSAANTSAGKRKADANDWENVNPVIFTKRAKGAAPAESIAKPSGFALEAHFSSAALPDFLSMSKPVTASTPRQTLRPKSQLAKLRGPTATPKSSPVATPAGRSPPGKQRAGLLSSRRRSTGPLSRVDRLSSSVLGSAKAKPWTLDGALKSTIKPATRHGKSKSRLSRGLDIGSKAAWFFEIHEDTPEQEMTNLLQHSTCVLDISSDEESSAKKKRDLLDGCDKENTPPAGFVAQAPPARPRDSATMASVRSPLGALNPRDFYAEGCDESSLFVVDDDEETEIEDNSVLTGFQFAPTLGDAPLDPVSETLDELVEKPAEGSSKAVVLEPIEGAEESFELWESGSAKDEAETAV